MPILSSGFFSLFYTSATRWQHGIPVIKMEVYRAHRKHILSWINEERSVTVFRLRFHIKIRQKGGVGVAKFLGYGGDLCSQQRKGGGRSVCIECLTIF
jgi:hypothetical protein